LYFIGFADSESIAGLDAAAQKNAMQSAANYMAEQFGQDATNINAEKLAKFLADSAEPYSSYISSTDNKIYRYYSLIRINKNAMKTGVQLFGVENNVDIPALIATIDESQRARDDYTARQTKLYENLEDYTKKKLAPALYLQFLKARQLRKEEKKYPEAISLLKEIVQQSPDFYLGWYNLSLAYDATDKSSDAQEAYNRAIELESSLPFRDATLYNSYGHFFYKQKKYQDALTQYNKSLKIDPTNPRTQNNLNQATKQLNLSTQ
jgi:tetratricopeptide (TPR) repeat protein